MAEEEQSTARQTGGRKQRASIFPFPFYSICITSLLFDTSQTQDVFSLSSKSKVHTQNYAKPISELIWHYPPVIRSAPHRPTYECLRLCGKTFRHSDTKDFLVSYEFQDFFSSYGKYKNFQQRVPRIFKLLQMIEILAILIFPMNEYEVSFHCLYLLLLAGMFYRLENFLYLIYLSIVFFFMLF